MSDLVRVAVDAMGGDYAPVEPVKGAVEAVNADERVKVQLVGQVDVIEKELQKLSDSYNAALDKAIEQGVLDESDLKPEGFDYYTR